MLQPTVCRPMFQVRKLLCLNEHLYGLEVAPTIIHVSSAWRAPIGTKGAFDSLGLRMYLVSASECKLPTDIFFPLLVSRRAEARGNRQAIVSPGQLKHRAWSGWTYS